MSLDRSWLTKSFSRRGTRSDGKYQLGEEGCKIFRNLHFHTTSPIIPPNASIPTPQPVFGRPMFGHFGRAPASLSLSFVSQAAYENGLGQQNGRGQEPQNLLKSRHELDRTCPFPGHPGWAGNDVVAAQ